MVHVAPHRQAWSAQPTRFTGPVEADETFVGGKAKSMHVDRRNIMRATGFQKTIVAGVKDRHTNHVRANVVENSNAETLLAYVDRHTQSDTMIYTDDFAGYHGLPATRLKRAHMGTFHKLSPKHLDRYVQEFVSKHNMRESGTLAQMRATAHGLIGRDLPYRTLIADNGLSSAARRA